MITLTLRGGAGDGQEIDYPGGGQPPAEVEFVAKGTTVYRRAGTTLLYLPVRLIDRITPAVPTQSDPAPAPAVFAEPDPVPAAKTRKAPAKKAPAKRAPRKKAAPA